MDMDRYYRENILSLKIRMGLDTSDKMIFWNVEDVKIFHLDNSYYFKCQI